MSIDALANYLDLHWHTVKDIEKNHLKKIYKRIRLKDVEYIGIDEVYVGHNKYLTIVRDMITGAVLFIGNGSLKKNIYIKHPEKTKTNILVGPTRPKKVIQ